MAYDTQDLHDKSLAAIEKHKLFFIDDVVSYLPCSKQTFYAHKLYEMDDIKEALERNRTDVKVSLRSKWYKSDNPTLQLALMKIIASDEERKRLSQQYHDLTSKGDKIQGASIVFGDHKPDTDNDT